MEGIVNSCSGSPQGTTASLFLTLTSALLTSQCEFSSNDQYLPEYNELRDGEEFDFIIVGAGTAGSVVANRLSENPNWRILVLEAGTYPSADSEVPSLTFHLQNTDEDWQYQAEPSEQLRFKNKTRCPCGKGLGGSSLLSYMMYFSGTRHDFDTWSYDGNEGWNYSSVSHHFKKFENIEGNGDGQKGELRLSQLVRSEPIIPHLINAYGELGYNNEYNAEKPLGIANSYFTIANGRRYNTAKAFLGQTVRNRPNLHLVLNAHVTKVLIDSQLHVEGVEVRLKGKFRKIFAKNEVILSAGAVNSPQILMNSGIGPKSHLNSLGIKVIKDLRVGENLQDHIVYTGLFYKLDQSALNPIVGTKIDDIYQYLSHGTGKLASLGINLSAFVNSTKNADSPSLQILHRLVNANSFNRTDAEIAIDALQLPDNITDTIRDTNRNSHTGQFLIGLSYPKSRGKVTLRSSDPFDKPLVYPNYLGNNDDVATFIEGIRFVQRLVKTKHLERYHLEPLTYSLGDCHEFTFDTDEYWDCSVRNLVRTLYHLVGTCKMGPNHDPDAVVNSRLKVHGLQGLRVIDASIMPSIVGPNPLGAIILIGEKGSQMIKSDWYS
ncbi:hypothetical protein RI129_012372 [Pyrocoelia pectoralis]|uniref:Glucose-methanol-choline oxidoreductase N-terminal domain-containing protein n=1 Tax=Pyrocoelia pectoralis TaxID=417401 RepID=A0AAN7ZC27_9COLE